MTSEAIARLVTKFEVELTKNAAAYHPIDIERVRTEEWQVKRFILDQPDSDETKAFEAMCKALQWKKSFGVHDRADQYYPKELWQLNGVEINGKDNAGRLIQWEGFKNQKVFKEITLLARQFFAHNLERVDRRAGETGFVLICDSNGSGLSNVDLDFSKFKIACIEMYPQTMKAMYIVDLPWLLNAVVKLILGLMNDQLKQVVRFVKSADLVQDVDAKWIPQALKGNRVTNAFPKNLVSMEQRAHELGLDEKFVDHFYKNFKLKRPSSNKT